MTRWGISERVQRLPNVRTVRMTAPRPVIPPTAAGECESCGDEFDPQEGCHHDGHAYCGSCFVERCPECRADLADDYAAEFAMERDR